MRARRGPGAAARWATGAVAVVLLGGCSGTPVERQPVRSSAFVAAQAPTAPPPAGFRRVAMGPADVFVDPRFGPVRTSTEYGTSYAVEVRSRRRLPRSPAVVSLLLTPGTTVSAAKASYARYVHQLRMRRVRIRPLALLGRAAWRFDYLEDLDGRWRRTAVLVTVVGEQRVLVQLDATRRAWRRYRLGATAASVLPVATRT